MMPDWASAFVPTANACGFRRGEPIPQRVLALQPDRTSNRSGAAKCQNAPMPLNFVNINAIAINTSDV